MSSPTNIPTMAPQPAAMLLAALAAPGDEKGDVADGRTAFEERCTGCHVPDHEKGGPRLAFVAGRMAGAVSAFPYSVAGRKSGVVWNEAVLDNSDNPRVAARRKTGQRELV
jgi:cytochrome c